MRRLLPGVLVLGLSTIALGQTPTATAPATPTAEPELNLLLRAAATAIRAEDTASLAALDGLLGKLGPLGPDAAERTRRGMQSLKADQDRRLVLDAMERFPLIEAVPASITLFSVTLAGKGESPIACRLSFARQGARWVLHAVSAPRASDEAFDVGTFSGRPERGQPAQVAFSRADMTDLRDLLRDYVTRRPPLADLAESMPSIRGFWPSTTDVRLTLFDNDEGIVRLHFEKDAASGRWQVGVR